MIKEITRNANIITIETDFYTFSGKALSVTYDLRKQSFTDNGLTFDNCSMSNADSRAIKYFLHYSFVDHKTNAICLADDYTKENLEHFISDLYHADHYIRTADGYADHL